MEQKINIAELLKDCPKGMELDCPMFEGLELDYIGNDISLYPIHCRVKTGQDEYSIENFTKYGCFTMDEYAKCVIFPKGKTTWENFTPPVSKTFKDGDIIYNRLQNRICIYQCVEGGSHCINYCRFNEYTKTFELLDDYLWIAEQDYRLATEKEKQKLFNAIKENGYRWNAETKTLEKLIEPQFKVGDRLQYQGYIHRPPSTIKSVETDRYILDNDDYIKFSDENFYRLCKFDITTLKPFDKVLVRDKIDDIWMIEFYGFFKQGVKYPFKCHGQSIAGYKQCIPYEGNEHLLGTADVCDEYFKVWEN